MNDINVLVVEDDRDISRLLAKCLSNEGYLADCAYNGTEAMELFNTKTYQMIILDLMIPFIDGYEVLRRVREKANIPVLILSAKTGDTDKIIGLGLGAD